MKNIFRLISGGVRGGLIRLKTPFKIFKTKVFSDHAETLGRSDAVTSAFLHCDKIPYIKFIYYIYIIIYI